MNKQVALRQIGFLLIFLCLNIKVLHAFTCDPKLIHKEQKNFYLNEKQKTLWISVSEGSAEFFNVLGYKKIASTDLRIQHLSVGNISSCSSEANFYKTYSYIARTQMFSIFVNNACQEKLAKNLGFTLSQEENYGSMESGILVQWSNIGLCTDGKKISHCETTKEMQDCFKQLFR